jgi:pilus assembly protein Flp/PilA
MLFAPKEKGQGLVEYALILVLVAIVVIAVLMLLGPIIGNVFSTINSSMGG